MILGVYNMLILTVKVVLEGFSYRGLFVFKLVRIVYCLIMIGIFAKSVIVEGHWGIVAIDKDVDIRRMRDRQGGDTQGGGGGN